MLPTIRKNQNWLSGFFNDFFDNEGLNINRLVGGHAPAVNVIETDKAYKVEIAAPGMTKEDFKISVINNYLDISLEKKQEKDEKCDKDGEEKCDEKYLRREFSYTRFEQRLLLPDNVKEDEIEAKMKHGVLRILLPKEQTEPQTVKQKMIEIK